MRKTHFVTVGLIALGAALVPATALASPQALPEHAPLAGTPVSASPQVLTGSQVLTGPQVLTSPPANLDSPFTDEMGVTDDPGAIESALDSIPNGNLWVVVVDNTDGMDAQQWAALTHRVSNLPRHDGVLVISVDDEQLGWYAPGSEPGVTDAGIDKALTDAVLDMLAYGEWQDGILAIAQNMESIADGGDAVVGAPEPFPWLAVGVGVIAIGGGAGAVATIRRRKSAANRASKADTAVRDASTALLATDDDVRGAAAELEFARAEFGLEATQEFQQTLETARAATQKAFQIHGQLHDANPESSEHKEQMSAQINELVTTAREALDKHTQQFSQLRNLAANAEAKVAQIDTRMSEISANADVGNRTIDSLAVNVSPAALETLRTYPEQVRHLLEATNESLTAARAELDSNDRNGAVPYIRLAEATLNQASQLSETIMDAPRVFAQKQSEVEERITSLSSDIADANRLAGNEQAVVPLRTQAEDVIRRAKTGQADPFVMAEELHDAETHIDLALAPYRQADEARKRLENDALRARGLTERALSEADSAISRYRSSAGITAREEFARAQDDFREGDQAADPRDKIRLFEQARARANRAKRAVLNDVSYTTSRSYHSSDSFAGAMAGSIVGSIVEGILFGGPSGGSRRTYGGGRSGGFSRGGSRSFGSRGGGSRSFGGRGGGSRSFGGRR